MMQTLLHFLILGAFFSLIPCKLAFAQVDTARRYYRQIFQPAHEAIEHDAELTDAQPNRIGCTALAVPGHVEMEALTPAEVSEFKDPFAERVFLPSPNERTFTKIIDLLLGRPSTAADPGYEIMIVREWIKQSQADLSPIERRFVVLFMPGHPLRSRCMLSGVLTAEGIQEDLEFLEVWGWDPVASSFRYYELTSAGWSFVGKSPELGEPSGLSATNRCLHCHRSGTPVMKELRLPWNNWNSRQSPNEYLTREAANAWPGIKSASAEVGDPEDLETEIKTAIGRFNRAQITAKINETSDERVIADIELLIKPLFIDRDLNFTSSRDNSPNSAFHASPTTPAGQIRVPGGFLLAHNLIGNGDTNFDGLGLAVADQLDQMITMPAQKYADLVKARELAVRLTDPDTGVATFRSGTDTDFAFFTPVRSYADDHFVGRLLAQNVITREFIAAALLIDVDKPILSSLRKSVYEKLSGFLPDEIKIPNETFADHRDHPLTKHIVDKVATMTLEADDPLKVFADLLSKDESPVTKLEQHWQTQHEALATASQNPDTAQSQKAFEELFDRLLARRRSFRENPEFSVLDETTDPATGRSAALLPSPPVAE